MKKILVAIPTYSGQIPIEIVFNLLQMKVPEGYQVNFSYCKRTLIDIARNGIAQGMLNNGHDYLFFVDDDTIPPTDALKVMLELDKPIVVAPVPARREGGENRLCIFSDDQGTQLSELKEERKVSAGGMSCTLIRRDALEAVANKFGKPFAFERIGEIPWTEDTNFCRRAGLLGFETWATPKVCPQHIGQPVIYVYEPQNEKSETYILPC